MPISTTCATPTRRAKTTSLPRRQRGSSAIASASSWFAATSWPLPAWMTWWTSEALQLRHLSLAPGLLEEVHPVAVHDAFDGDLRVAALLQQVGQPLQVGDRIQVHRRLLAAKAAVEVGADGGVAMVTCKLADAVDMIDDAVELDTRRFGRRLAADPTGHHHPGVERRADDGPAVDQALNLMVG